MRIPADVARGPRRRYELLPDLEAVRAEGILLRSEMREAKEERTLGDDCAEMLLAAFDRRPFETSGRQLAFLRKGEILSLARRMRALGRAS